MTLDRLSSLYFNNEVEDESGGDRVDYYVNYSCTQDEGDWVNRDDDDDSKCISKVGFPFQVEQVDDREENCEDED